ncbi:transposase, partial [Cereibacter azotoformans]|uniref:transposase n=1 Tax=Cereibacter azotoformans TaxID=43057 RepID=UPI00117A8F4D
YALLPLLEAWIAVRGRAAELGRQLLRVARHSEACQRLMSVPDVGAITATSFATAIEDPENFRNSRSVAAWIGLTTRRYQSGEV